MLGVSVLSRGLFSHLDPLGFSLSARSLFDDTTAYGVGVHWFLLLPTSFEGVPSLELGHISQGSYTYILPSLRLGVSAGWFTAYWDPGRVIPLSSTVYSSAWEPLRFEIGARF